jgi:hypothetical protein
MSRDRDASHHQHVGSIPRGWRWVFGRFLSLLIVSAALVQLIPVWAGVSTAGLVDAGSLVNSQSDLMSRSDAAGFSLTCPTLSSFSVRVTGGDRKVINDSGAAFVGNWNSIRDLCRCESLGASNTAPSVRATLVDLNVRLQI